MSKVIDFQAKRRDSIEKKKRSFERVLFSEFLGSYAELDENGTKYEVNMVDLSHDGCLFQVPFHKNTKNHFEENQDVTVEMQAFTYLSLNLAPLTVADETPLYAFALV